MDDLTKTVTVANQNNAQNARAKKPKKMNSSARYQEKKDIVLRWLYEFGWTSSALINRITGNGRDHRFIKRLEAAKLVDIKPNDHKTEEHSPKHLVYLTSQGIAEACTMMYSDGERFPYNRRHNLSNIDHDHLLQLFALNLSTFTPSITLDDFRKGKLVSERRRHHDRKILSRTTPHVADKVYDLIFENNTGKDRGARVGVEFERTSKWDDDLCRFQRKIDFDVCEGRIQQVLILVHREPALKHYQRAFETGSSYNTYYYDKGQKKWLVDTEETVDERTSAAVKVLLINPATTEIVYL